MLRDDALVAALDDDWTTAPLSGQRKAMLEFAVKLTHTPGKIAAADADRLRAVEFSDRDILDIVEVTAYYAYANRIADGLGIADEPWITD